MLTDSEIQKALKVKDIKISPYDKSQLESGNYRVKLGSKLLIPNKGLTIKIDEPSDQTLYEEFDLKKSSYILKPKEFLLGQTLEKIGVNKNIAGILDGRSTFARLGVSIHQSSQFIAPGQDFHIITLEIYNAGEFNVELKYECIIGKIIFFQFNELNNRGYDDYGRYKGQKETTGARLS